jgi:hypothetical protein
LFFILSVPLIAGSSVDGTDEVPDGTDHDTPREDRRNPSGNVALRPQVLWLVGYGRCRRAESTL